MSLGGALLDLEVRKCVTRDANVCMNPLDMDARNFTNGRKVEPD